MTDQCLWWRAVLIGDGVLPVEGADAGVLSRPTSRLAELLRTGAIGEDEAFHHMISPPCIGGQIAGAQVWLGASGNGAVTGGAVDE